MEGIESVCSKKRERGPVVLWLYSPKRSLASSASFIDQAKDVGQIEKDNKGTRASAIGENYVLALSVNCVQSVSNL